ncbi:hypothetical protein Ahia01_000555700 [Argonauta hians]
MTNSETEQPVEGHCEIYDMPDHEENSGDNTVNNSTKGTTNNGVFNRLGSNCSAIYTNLYIIPFSTEEIQAVLEVAIPMFPRNPKWIEFSPPVRLQVKSDIDENNVLQTLLAKLPDYSDSQLLITQCIHIVDKRKL